MINLELIKKISFQTIRKENNLSGQFVSKNESEECFE